MSEVARVGVSAVARRDAFASLNIRVALTWEAAGWCALAVLGFGFRLWDLGSRAMHHDESLHAYYAYRILQGTGYEHSPLLHGPLQFFATAATFFLAGGASDTSARLLPALAGGALVLLPLLLRSRLGSVGALAAGLFIAFSPVLLYYSRFAREDVYAALFTLGMVACLWRYVEERRPLYLYVSAALLALSFATKETTFVFVALLLLFLDLWVAAEFAAQSHRRGGTTAEGVYFLLYAPFAWALAALWPFTGALRRRLGLEERSAATELLLLFGTLSLPQFAAAVELPLEAAGIEIDTPAEEREVGVPAVLSLIAASALVGLAWRARVWAAAAACFYGLYVLLFSAFLTDIDGVGSGIWESLDFWLGQHEARRATQPDFYYLMFPPVYEYLALAFAGPALIYLCLRGGPRSWWLTAIAVFALLFLFGADSFEGGTAVEAAQYVMIPLAAVALFAAVRGTMFERFLVFWTVGALVAYSFIGEKMPWLNVHIALPLAVLAGHAIGRLSGKRPAVHSEAPRPGRSETRPFARRLLAIVTAIAMVTLLAFSLRTAILATYDHGDVPREFLFYTQTSPDVPNVVERIDLLAERSGREEGLRIQVDAADKWPWAWYLRDYDLSFDEIGPEFVPEPDAVLLVSAANERFSDSYRGSYLSPQPYTLRWWFPEDYRETGEKDDLGEGLADFGEELGDGDTWDRWWQYWLHRDIMPREGIEGLLFVPLAFEAIDLGPAPSAPVGRGESVRAAPDVEGRYIIGGLGTEPGQMQSPLGVALDSTGNVYVVDVILARIQKFDARGTLVGTAGGAGVEPLQFNQPSDVAVDAAGNVYVADTWNHRIQKLGPDLSFVGAWGRPTNDLINPEPDELWAPRGLAIDQEGNLLVADTGTHRIRRYAPDGTHLGDFGRRGREGGEFDEPTGVAVGPDGSVYVAEAGNARVQKFDAAYQFVAAWPVEDWADRLPRNKPQVEALPDGRLITTDGPHARLLLIARDGRVSARLDEVAGVPLFSPEGLAFDAETGFAYVTDGLAGHVRRFPFTDFALR